METGRRPRRRDLVLFVLLHAVIVAASGVAIWQVISSAVGPEIGRAVGEVAARLPMVAGLLIVLAILATSARRP
jgi:hypothetical protein